MILEAINHSGTQTKRKRKKAQLKQSCTSNRHETFTPLVFSCYGGMAYECNAFYKRLASLLAEKKNQQITVVTSWLRTKLSFSILRLMLLCIRGSRGHKTAYKNAVESISLAALKCGLFKKKNIYFLIMFRPSCCKRFH